MTNLANGNVGDAARALYEVLEETDNVRVYSGRCMYGRTCIGAKVDDGEDPLDFILGLVSAYAENAESASDVRDFADAIRGAQVDTLGRGSIVYWPELEVPDVHEDGDEDGDEDEDEDAA